MEVNDSSLQFADYPGEKGTIIAVHGNSALASGNTGIKPHIEQPILMDYSMGAFIMANVASKRKEVKGVILFDGSATCTDHQRQIVEPSLGRISKEYFLTLC